MKPYYILCSLLILNFNLWAVNYYVSLSGNDSFSGTSITNAWKSMNKVNAFAASPGFKAGDSILFHGGQTFVTSTGISIQLNINKGTSSSPISFSSYGTGNATLKENACDAFDIVAPSSGAVSMGLSFTNLIIEGDSVAKPGPVNTLGIYLWNSSSSDLDYFLIQNVEILGFAGNGIYTGRDPGKGRFDNLVLRRVVSHNNPGAVGVSPHSGSGILVSGADGALIEHCIAYNNGINNNNPGGPIGIWIFDCINSTIQYSESHDNQTTHGDGGGFDIDGGCSKCIIQYCYSHDNAGAGYLFAQFSGASSYGPFKHNTVRYNISQNDGRKGSYGGISFWGNDSVNRIDTTYVYNNTVYMGSTASTPAAVYFLDGNFHGVKIWNNIFIASDNFNLINATTAIDSSKVQFQNNDYWAQPGTTFKITWGSKTYNSLSAWQTAVAGEEKLNNKTNLGLNIVPMLYNAGGGVTLNNTYILNTLSAYKLKNTSYLINKGLDLTKPPFKISVGTSDFFGNSIPQNGAYSIGAYDTLPSAVPPDTIPPVPSLMITPDSINFGKVLINTTAVKSYTLTGQNLITNVTIYLSIVGYEVSFFPDSGFARNISAAPAYGTLNIPIYVRFAPVAVKSYNSNIANESEDVSTFLLPVTGTGVNTTAIDNEQSVQVSSFPNPASSNLHILNCSGFEYISLFTMSGLQMLSKNIGLENEISLNIESLPVGTYIIQLTGKTSQAKMLIFQKE